MVEESHSHAGAVQLLFKSHTRSILFHCTRQPACLYGRTPGPGCSWGVGSDVLVDAAQMRAGRKEALEGEGEVFGSIDGIVALTAYPSRRTPAVRIAWSHEVRPTLADRFGPVRSLPHAPVSQVDSGPVLQEGGDCQQFLVDIRGSDVVFLLEMRDDLSPSSSLASITV